MSVPLQDPEHGLWVCPDDGRILRLMDFDWQPLTYRCPGCGASWDVATMERVAS